MDETEIEGRVEFLQESYIDGDLTEDEFEMFLEAALDGETPYFYDWFREQMTLGKARHKRYEQGSVYIYKSTEYIVKGKRVVETEDGDLEDRVIDVTA